MPSSSFESALEVADEESSKRLRWAAVCLAAALLAAAAGAVLAGLSERSAAETLLGRSAEQVAAEVNGHLQRTLGALTHLAASPALQRADYAGFHEVAWRAVAADAMLDNLQLIDAQGRQVVNARLPFGAQLPPLNRPDLPLMAVSTKAPVVSNVEMGAVAKRMLTVVYLPVIRDGNVIHVLAGATEPPNWREALHAKLPAGVDAILLDRHSFVVTATRTAEPDGAEFPLPSGVGQLAPDFRRVTVHGHRVFYSVRKVPLSGWSVVTLMPDSSAGWVHKHKLWIQALIPLGLLACALMFARGGRVLYRG